MAKLDFSFWFFVYIKKRPFGRYLLLMQQFAFCAIDFAQGSVKRILGFVDWQVVGSAIFNHFAAKAEFVLRKVIPRVFFVGRVGCSPEVKVFLAVALGINDHLGQNCYAW